MCVLLVALLAISSGVPSGLTRAEEIDGVLPSAEEVLARAFANQYEVDTTATIELIMRSDRGQERQRHFESASKMIDERMHAIGRLVRPEYLRGMTILQIEAGDRGHDAFVYLPSLRKVRRISTSQRGDAFFGTDVTYEDLERRRLEDYQILSARAEDFEGEGVYAIQVQPLRDSTYAEAVFTVSLDDYAILEARYFKRGTDAPYRIMTSLRSGMMTGDGHVLPTRLRVQNLSKGTTTDITFRDLRINPVIDDRIFSIRTLEQERDLSKSLK
jgi:outer membrane lipoprotein-sorting protein